MSLPFGAMSLFGKQSYRYFITRSITALLSISHSVSKCDTTSVPKNGVANAISLPLTPTSPDVS